MHNIDLILTLTGGLSAALLLGYVTQRLGLSPIVGYLLAGVAVGPWTPGYVADRALAEQLSEVGVILLMFGVGLQFHLTELLAVKNVAIPGAVGQSLAATVLGAFVGRLFGWEWSSGIVFGLALSVASTVVLIRILSDNRVLHTPTGHIAVGWLVVEDIFTVIALVLLPALGGQTEGGAAGIFIAAGIAVLKVGLLMVFVLWAGSRLIPVALEKVAKTGSRELFTLAVLVIALGIAVGSAKIFDVSMALGAFVAGMVVNRSDFAMRAATDALPMRDAFAVLFFVAVGMLLDPRQLIEQPALIAATLAVIMIAKPIAALVIVVALRYPFRVAMAVAAALAQVGEFSFILANAGNALGILSDDANNAVIAAAIVSITLNPLLFRGIKPLEAWITRHPRVWRFLNRRAMQRIETGTAPAVDPSRSHSVRHRAVVIGYGPVGRTLSRLLIESEMEVSIVEMDVDKVRELREHGISAIYGDATQEDTLNAAGVATAGSLILSSSSLENAQELIRLARTLNPKIQILARTSYVRESRSLKAAGASMVFAGEGEVAFAMMETVLRDLGATPDQIDRERKRLRDEIFA
ncbi:MAG TPA: cation:proton antiporter [Thermoanaerobaculia bacterium]|nr:cation:proton antiporter [Thermoanaerobaculia bacterium]